MRKPLNVSIAFDKIHCISRSEIGADEPYFLSLFVKLDGSSLKISKDGYFEGTATVHKTNSKQGNLGIAGMSGGDSVAIPGIAGTLNTTLTPIPIDPAFTFGEIFFLDKTLPGIIVAIGVLMEEDSTAGNTVSDSYEMLIEDIENQVNALLPTLKVMDVILTDFSGRFSFDAIAEKIKSRLSLFEIIPNLIDPDDQIGHIIELFNHDGLLEFNKKDQTSIYTFAGEEGTYQVDLKVAVNAPVWCHITKVLKSIDQMDVSPWKKVIIDDYCFKGEAHEYCIKTDSIKMTFMVETFNFGSVIAYSWFLSGVLLDETKDETSLLVDVEIPNPPDWEFKKVQETVTVKYKIYHDTKGYWAFPVIHPRTFIELEITNPKLGNIYLPFKVFAQNFKAQTLMSAAVTADFEHQSIIWDSSYTIRLIDCLKSTLPANLMPINTWEGFNQWRKKPWRDINRFQQQIETLEAEVARLSEVTARMIEKISEQ